MVKVFARAAICLTVAAALSLGAFAAASAGTSAVRSVSIGVKAVTLKVGGQKMIAVNISPGYAADKTVTWSTSNPAVAEVTPIDDALTGAPTLRAVITAVGEGKARITAASNNGKTSVCSVTVSNDKVNIIRLEMASDTATVRMNQKRTLFVDVFPNNADDMTFDWRSSNPEIAAIETNGGPECTVIAVSPGTALITAVSGNEKVAECKVTVPSSVLTGIEREVSGEDIPGALSGSGEILTAAGLRLDFENAIKADKKAKQITLTYSGKTEISSAALRSVGFTAAYDNKEAILRFSTPDAEGKTQGRLTIWPQNAPEKDMSIGLAIYTSRERTQNAMARGEKRFGTAVAVARLSHSGDFNMPVRVAAKTDTKITGGAALHIYREYGGEYTRLDGQEYRADGNGYVYFTAAQGGTYIMVPIK